MPSPVKYLLGAYVMAMFVAVFYLIVKLWPLNTAQPIVFFWGQAQIPEEIRLMILAALAGALGAYIHLATSFADFAGNDALTASWGWWYLLRPFIGMSLAEVVYLSLRGGLLSTGGNGAAGAISPYGVAAVASLTGLFSKQATDKLREVFETLFRTQEKVERRDALPTAPASPPPASGAGGEASPAAAAARAGQRS